MYLTETEIREGLAQGLKALFQVLQVNLLALLDEGEYDIDLPALVNLPADTVIERRHAIVEDVGGADGLSAWWQLIDDAHVKVAIQGHGQCTRNGRGCHHKDVGDGVAFCLCP